ncbi:nitroreductase family protein [Vagococcus elongatus]|uniref:Putative nitroreductase TM1586 domain-containing protein n=1 Tax=Vagococcus elongatus TaxID=180344 RepID=A0A430AZN6_9ENTE|nr:nitroreductase family protein [Vagococcus elongatus]RSU13540.1 hypothetical protein CBF29_04615 [Vagococcus elongatus]
MTLYETIFTRRQVRRFRDDLLDQQQLLDIETWILNAKQFSGQQAKVALVTDNEVSHGQGAPYYLLVYCDNHSSAYGNAGFVLQQGDLYLQSLGLGSGWFAGVKPKRHDDRFCIGLAFGKTDVPARKSEDEFKRKSIETISPMANAVAAAVRLAPSSLNSQPWRLAFGEEKVTITDVGSGIKRMFLKNKLNKIDLGIAASHAVIALTHEGNTVIEVIPRETNQQFEIDIFYR